MIKCNFKNFTRQEILRTKSMDDSNNDTTWRLALSREGEDCKANVALRRYSHSGARTPPSVASLYSCRVREREPSVSIVRSISQAPTGPGETKQSVRRVCAAPCREPLLLPVVVPRCSSDQRELWPSTFFRPGRKKLGFSRARPPTDRL